MVKGDPLRGHRARLIYPSQPTKEERQRKALRLCVDLLRDLRDDQDRDGSPEEIETRLAQVEDAIIEGEAALGEED
jgi:hypothetical protein